MQYFLTVLYILGYIAFTDCISRRISMKTLKLLIQITPAIKANLDALRAQGTTASGFIRNLLTKHFNRPQAGRKAR